MRTREELEAALARSVREKIRRAGEAARGPSRASVELLVAAWPYLRPLFPNAVPGQVGLTADQRRGLQVILDTMAGGRGAGANGPHIRRLQQWDAVRVVACLHRLAESLPRDDAPPIRASQLAPSLQRAP